MRRERSKIGEDAPSPRFPIFEFLVLFIPVSLIVLVAGYSVSQIVIESRISDLSGNDEKSLLILSGFVGADVSGTLNDLRALSSTPELVRALDATPGKVGTILEPQVLAVARSNPRYHQIRWIDQAGTERLRVMQGDKGPYRLAKDKHQDKSDRYYFKAANRLMRGETYISRLDLNEEHGAIEFPPKPMLRVAMALLDRDGGRHGILIINILMQYSLRLLESAAEGATYQLLNQAGMRINRPYDAAQSRSDYLQAIRFAANRPELWARIKSQRSGSSERADGLWTWRTLSPVSSWRSPRTGTGSSVAKGDAYMVDEFVMTLVAHRGSAEITDIRSESRFLASLGVLLILAIFGFSLFFYLSGHLHSRQAELTAARAMERSTQLTRINELEQRFHKLVEASGIGQLVVDGNGVIEIANPAAERMLGYEEGELVGRPVEILIEESQRGIHEQFRVSYLRDPEARQMGSGRALRALRRDGGRIALEIGLNPYSDEGRPLVLVSMIDLSRWHQENGAPTGNADEAV